MNGNENVCTVRILCVRVFNKDVECAKVSKSFSVGGRRSFFFFSFNFWFPGVNCLITAITGPKPDWEWRKKTLTEKYLLYYDQFFVLIRVLLLQLLSLLKMYFCIYLKMLVVLLRIKFICLELFFSVKLW